MSRHALNNTARGWGNWNEDSEKKFPLFYQIILQAQNSYFCLSPGILRTTKRRNSGASVCRDSWNAYVHIREKLHLNSYGTQEKRFGKDSQLPFGHCALSLAPAVNPVARCAALDILKENSHSQARAAAIQNTRIVYTLKLWKIDMYSNVYN